jgi:hypothetical protein
MKNNIIIYIIGILTFMTTNCQAITLIGTVTDITTGKAISNVVVSADDQYQTKTNNKGNYELQMEYPGLYDITFSKTGYQSLTMESIYMIADHELNVSLTTPGLLNIIASHLSDTQTGKPYNEKVYITGGTYPYTFEIVSGELPSGLTLNPETGHISGISIKIGAFNFTIGVTDVFNAYAEKDFSIVVTSPLTILTETLPQGTENEWYAFSIQASGGEQPYIFKVFNDLPLNLYLTQNGTIENYITRHIDFSTDVLHHFWKTNNASVSNNRLRLNSLTSSAEIELNCIDGTLSFDYLYYLACGVSSLCGKFDFYLDNELIQSWFSTVNNSGTFEMPVPLGKHIFKWTFINKHTSENYFAFLDNISFPVDLQGKHYFTISLTDAANRTTEKQLTLNVLAPFSITTSNLDNGVTGQVYNYSLSTTGGQGRIKWSVYAGSLPVGLTFSTGSGIISGTPLESTLQSIVFEAIDENNNHVYQDMVLHIADPLQIESSAFPDAQIHENYAEPVRCLGGIPPFNFQIEGQLPSGLSLNPQTGIISGTPEEASFVNYKIIVSDSTYPLKQTAEKIFGLRTDNRLIITSASQLPDIRQGVAINPIVLKAAGGASMLSWTIVENELPPGISLISNTGELSGIPLNFGNYQFTLRVFDQHNENTAKTFYWHVVSTLTIAQTTIPSAIRNMPYYYDLNASGGLSPYDWQISSGVLPDGLSFSSKTGCIFGVPKTIQSRMLTIVLKDSDMPQQIEQKQFTLNVLEKSTIPGDMNNNYCVDLQDAIIVLNLISNKQYVQKYAFDLNGNGQTGLAELIYILIKIGGYN